MSASEMPPVDSEKIIQDILDAFYDSKSTDTDGKKDYLDVIYKIYYMHLQNSTPAHQNHIFRTIADFLKDNAPGIGLRHPFKAFNIKNIINSADSPQWIKDITSNTNLDVDSWLLKILKEKITVNNGTAYNSYIKENKEKIDADNKWRNASLFEKIKIFFKGLVEKIKNMFSTIEPELVTKEPVVSSESRIDSNATNKPANDLKTKNPKVESSRLSQSAKTFSEQAQPMSESASKPSSISKLFRRVKTFSNTITENITKKTENTQKPNSGPPSPKG